MAHLIQEAKRFQRLAGIITENESPAEEKVKDQIEKTIDSPQTQSILVKIANELSDEEKQKILNFVSSINESESITEDVELDKVIDKLLPMTEENTLEEEENNLNAPKNLLKQFIFGAPVLAMGLGIAKGMSLGGGAAALAAVGPAFFGAAAAGAILIGLYKVIKAMKSNKEKSTKSSGSSGFNVLENSINEAVEIPSWLKGKLEDVHTKPGQGSIFAKSIDDVLKIAQDALDKEQNIDQIANSTGTLTISSPGIGYNLVLPIGKAKQLPGAQESETEKVEGSSRIKVPAITTSAPISQFKTDELTVIVRPKKDESGAVIPNEYIVLSAFPGDPTIPRSSEWSGKYAVIIPGKKDIEETVNEALAKFRKNKK